jgi:hypothetical protein
MGRHHHPDLGGWGLGRRLRHGHHAREDGAPVQLEPIRHAHRRRQGPVEEVEPEGIAVAVVHGEEDRSIAARVRAGGRE